MRIGEREQHNYFANTGGQNVTDTPFATRPDQAGVNSRNYDYSETGGFKKRLGQAAINSSADTQLQTVGMAARVTKNDSKQTIRSAGTKIQNFSIGAGTFTNLTDDTASAGSDFLASGTSQPVAREMFSTAQSDVLWLAGGGMSAIYGAYSSTKVTAIGTPVPTGSISTAVAGSGGSFASTGTYFYGVAFRKASTQTLSNVVLDDSATLSATSEEVTITLSSITNNDTTRYDKIYIYRSAVGGTSGFTTGDLIAIVDSTDTSYVDLGTSTVSSTNIARAGNTILDNSPLPAGTYNYMTMFKRRLVTVKDNIIYISDLNKPESFPLHNQFQLPSGGEVTGLGVISFNTPSSSDIDEFLCIFKQDEMRVLTGTGVVTAGIADWSLNFIDKEGCDSHNSIVSANGYIAWASKRGIFLWDGSGKPIYASRLVENYFGDDGDILQTNFKQVWGELYRKRNQIVWCFNHAIYGDLKFFLKMDLRLSLPRVQQDLSGRVMEAVFIPDTSPTSMYGAVSYIPDGENAEKFVAGDDTGFVYQMYSGGSDGTADIVFEYESAFLNQNLPNVSKHYYQVIVWVEDLGDWDLTLDYWTNYRTTDAEKSSIKQPISASSDETTALWDVGFWDEANWDDYQIRVKPLVYNLSDKNQIGDSIKIKISQTGTDEPVNVLGYSVIYAPQGVTK